MRVSFDFDSTLTKPHIQEIAKAMIKAGHYVRITTSRPSKSYPIIGEPECCFNNHDLYEVMREIGIDDVMFTEGEYKARYLDSFDLHFDDDLSEIAEIKEKCKNCKVIKV